MKAITNRVIICYFFYLCYNKSNLKGGLITLKIATYNVKNQVFYFNFIEDNKALVRVFPLEDYRKIDPDMKMDTYNLGVIYVKEDNGTFLKNEDDVFKYIPAECDCNVVYSKEPIFVETKPVPYYEDEETEEVSP